MLSKDLRALLAWFRPVAAGDFEMSAEGARAFVKNLERAAQDAEELEETAIAVERPARVLRGPMPRNVVAFRPRQARPSGTPQGGDAA